MSTGTTRATGSRCRVLCTGPDEARVEALAAPLQEAGIRVEKRIVTGERLDPVAAEVDCVVSAFDLGAIDGLSLLRSVRAVEPELPFVLCPLDGDEAVASEAVRAGVTDYVPIGDDTPPGFADRVRRSIERNRARNGAADRSILERISDAFFAVDDEWRLTYVNEAGATVLREAMEADSGGELLGRDLWTLVPDAVDTEFYERYRRAMETQEPVSFEEYYEPLDAWFEGRAYPDERGLSVYFTDITERKRREQATEQYRTLVETVGDPMFVLDPDGVVEVANGAMVDQLDADEESVVGAHISEFVTDSAYERSTALLEELLNDPDRNRATHEVTVVTTTGEQFPAEVNLALLTDAPGEFRGSVGVVRDITERKERERELERQRDELAELDRLNTLTREITRALQDTDTRDAIEAAVTERLTESELYQAAWIGTRRRSVNGSEAVVPQTVEGVGDSYRQAVTEHSGPGASALASGEVEIVDDVGADEAFPDPRREIALERGHHALAAVPLTTGETTYGVLVVYAPAGHAITDAERDVLDDLGHSIAQAIQRVYSRRSLASDTVDELRLILPDSDYAFAEATTELDCELRFVRYVPVSDAAGLQYVDVSGAEPADVCDYLSGVPFIDACNVVRDDDRSSIIEIRIADASKCLSSVLADHGASITTARAADGDVSLTVEIGPESDARDVVSAVSEVAAPVELVSKRVVDRPVSTVPELVNRATERLTTKQAAALRTAYTRGYFAWPRESTAEEVASAMDVASSTFHYHLRRAIETTLTAFFEEGRSSL